jgi:membrane-associated protein
MQWLTYALDFIRHIDDHLQAWTQEYGGWTYALLFLIIFLETGVVFTPLLPGDSLIFAAGALCTGAGGLNVWVLFALLTTAAILGDTANYAIGKYFGAYLLRRHARFFKPEHMQKTHDFYERYGGKTIIIARFVPIVRTFAPFVAGMGAMTYTRFFFYNVVGGIAWVAICLAAGYWFGQIEWVKKNFEVVVLAIIFISVLPIIIEVLRAKYLARKAAAAGAATTPGE